MFILAVRAGCKERFEKSMPRTDVNTAIDAITVTIITLKRNKCKKGIFSDVRVHTKCI